jgi:hypothetical protein
MKTFTIENETNNITLHTTIQDAEAVPNAERFRNEAGLAKLAADWPAARLIDIWKSLPGVTPVKKFKDRATTVNRIWKAIQSLGDTVEAAEQPAPVPEAGPSGEAVESVSAPEQDAIQTTQQETVIPEATEPAPATPVGPQVPDFAPDEASAKTKATRTKKAPKATETGAPREGSKTSQVIAMLKRKGGTTLEEIMTAMSWQKHTTRAMRSAGGSLTKNHGLIIISEKIGDKRTYSIKA